MAEDEKKRTICMGYEIPEEKNFAGDVIYVGHLTRGVGMECTVVSREEFKYRARNSERGPEIKSGKELKIYSGKMVPFRNLADELAELNNGSVRDSLFEEGLRIFESFRDIKGRLRTLDEEIAGKRYGERD
ncbi:hypothetical protein HY449_00805 [Candidatus Pacearchaeota archaeon]|nr:hypothetical protein [Candidatus Pacearchaeota archaeon]